VIIDSNEKFIEVIFAQFNIFFLYSFVFRLYLSKNNFSIPNELINSLLVKISLNNENNSLLFLSIFISIFSISSPMI